MFRQGYDVTPRRRLERRPQVSYRAGKMKSATRLTSKGQVVIPKPVRQRLRWRSGLRLEVEALPDGGVRLAPLSDDAIDAFIGSLRHGDPIAALEAEHRAETKADERAPRRRRFLGGPRCDPRQGRSVPSGAAGTPARSPRPP